MANTALVVAKQFTASVQSAEGLVDKTFAPGEVFDPADADGWVEGALENRVAHGFLKSAVVSTAEEQAEAASVVEAAQAEAKKILEAAQAEAAAIKLKAEKGK